jgi:hypothetical protein
VFLAHLLLVPATGCGINPARSFGSAIVAGHWKDHWLYWVWQANHGIQVREPFAIVMRHQQALVCVMHNGWLESDTHRIS